MIFLCRVLRLARELLVTSGQQWLGLTVNTNYAKEMLNGVFLDKLDSKRRGDTVLRHLVVGLKKVIWDYHCRIIFEREALVFDIMRNIQRMNNFSPPRCFSFLVIVFRFSFENFFLNFVTLMPPLGKATEGVVTKSGMGLIPFCSVFWSNVVLVVQGVEVHYCF